MNIIAQVINGLGTFTNICAINIKNKLKCLMFFTLGNTLVTIALILLNAKAGAIVETVFVIETLINYFLEKDKEDYKYPLWIVIIYILVPCLINAMTFTSMWNILPILSSIAFPLAMLSKNTLLRILNLISVAVWVPYNIVFGNYVGAIGCAIFTVINAITIVRYDILKK